MLSFAKNMYPLRNRHVCLTALISWRSAQGILPFHLA